jgi:hypothetical protein
MFKCNWRNAMLLEEYLIIRRRDEIRLEKGESAANALMGDVRHDMIEGGTTDKKALPSSSVPGAHPQTSSTSSSTPTKPPPAYRQKQQNDTVTPIITEVDDDGNEIVDPEVAAANKDKKKYGTFFSRWRL